MRCSSTVCLVESIPVGQGPWLWWHDLEHACSGSAQLGFDGIELFAPAPAPFEIDALRAQLDRHGLALSAVGTGAGKVLEGLDLTHPDADVRARAASFIAETIDFASALGAPTIVGSMQGIAKGRVERDQALAWLAEAVAVLGRRAADRGTCLLLEPLNRYEGDLLRTLAATAELIGNVDCDGGVRILADLFHMNIEEAQPADALRSAGAAVGHVHLADSHRGPAGTGHTDFAAIGAALRAIGFDGFVSAEAFPNPDPATAARHTIDAFRTHIAR